MKNICFLVVLLGIMACTSSSKPESIDNNQITKKEVHITIAIWAQAMLENQLKPQQEVLDSTWMYSGSDDGKITTKEKALEGFKPGQTSLKEVVLRDTLVRLYGNFAIVTGKEELVFVEQNDTNRVRLRFTDVFMKKDGKVTALSTHSSQILNNESKEVKKSPKLKHSREIDLKTNKESPLFSVDL